MPAVSRRRRSCSQGRGGCTVTLAQLDGEAIEVRLALLEDGVLGAELLAPPLDPGGAGNGVQHHPDGLLGAARRRERARGRLSSHRAASAGGDLGKLAETDLGGRPPPRRASRSGGLRAAARGGGRAAAADARQGARGLRRRRRRRGTACPAAAGRARHRRRRAGRRPAPRAWPGAPRRRRSGAPAVCCDAAATAAVTAPGQQCERGDQRGAAAGSAAPGCGDQLDGRLNAGGAGPGDAGGGHLAAQRFATAGGRGELVAAAPAGQGLGQVALQGRRGRERRQRRRARSGPARGGRRRSRRDGGFTSAR